MTAAKGGSNRLEVDLPTRVCFHPARPICSEFIVFLSEFGQHLLQSRALLRLSGKERCYGSHTYVVSIDTHRKAFVSPARRMCAASACASAAGATARSARCARTRAIVFYVLTVPCVLFRRNKQSIT